MDGMDMDGWNSFPTQGPVLETRAEDEVRIKSNTMKSKICEKDREEL